MHVRLFGYVLMQTQIYKVLGGDSSAEVLCIDHSACIYHLFQYLASVLVDSTTTIGLFSSVL